MADPSLLECFENPCPQREYVIEHHADPFTIVCPKTGHPDFGSVLLRYVPHQLCVELKSLKLYLQAYRNEGIFYEAVTNRIAEDLYRVTESRWLMIETRWAGRGGIQSTIRVEMGHMPEQVTEEFDDDAPLERPSDDDRVPPGY